MNTVSELQRLGLPPIDQIGFVVRDLASWMTRYDALFGPFQQMQANVTAATYRGRSADVELAIAFGRSGDLEMEFIEWKSGDSPHREFLDSGREGMHHVRFRIDNCPQWMTRLESEGFAVIWHKVYSADTEFAYLQKPGDSLIIELLQMPPKGNAE